MKRAMKKLVMIGAGGHAESVADCIDEQVYELAGFIDELYVGSHLGVRILGKNITEICDYKSYQYFITIGDNANRKRWYDTLVALGLPMINIIDRTALVSKSARLGVGNFIGKQAIINAGAIVGDNNIINTKALIEHDCQVDNHTHLSTNSTINGGVQVEDLVFLGSSAVCNCTVRLGYGSIVGSGSVVIDDVPANTTVVGCPARVINRHTL